MFKDSKSLAFASLFSVVLNIFCPQYALASINSDEYLASELTEKELYELVLSEADLAQLEGLAMFQDQAMVQPASPSLKPIAGQKPKTSNVLVVLTTAYSSTPDQTDDSPFITANGTYVRDGIIACNFLKFGTKVRFPELYGDKVFTVEDRMAKRNSHKMDIWFPTREAALAFGVRNAKVEILN